MAGLALSQVIAAMGEKATVPHSTPSVSPRSMDAKRFAASNPLTGQNHENDVAELVIVCKPSLPRMMGTLHPAASLYEKPVNIPQADLQHDRFKKMIQDFGIKVMDVREVLADIGDSVKLRVQLEDLAARSLTYVFDHNDGESSPRASSSTYYASDEYKASVLSAISADQLVDIVLTRPTVTIRCSHRDTGFIARYEFEPLSNLVFTRDQQVTTRKGIVMARLRSSQRQCEVEVMRYVFERLGLAIIGEIPEEAHLEGGDFFPCGDGLCFIGIGMRSDMAAVEYMLHNDLFGTTYVAVVEDRFDQSQDRMHLDCCFNILSRDCVLCWESMLGADSPTRRLVTEFQRDHRGVYTKVREEVEFSEYLTEKGFHIIPVSPQAQLAYGCNVLNVGNQNVIAVNAQTAREIVRSPHFKGDVKFLDFSQITNMYGAVHCASQVVKRSERRPFLGTFFQGI
eukprot:RCo043365